MEEADDKPKDLEVIKELVRRPTILQKTGSIIMSKPSVNGLQKRNTMRAPMKKDI